MTFRITRRELTQDIGRLIGLATIGGSPPGRRLFAQSPKPAQVQEPGTNGEPMIVYSREYLTLEMPMSRLTTWITPTESFFVRNNLLMPEFNSSDWSLAVTGEVQRPLSFTLREFRQLAGASVTNTMECAGNGRVNFRPRIAGVPWGRGGVGNAVFEGPRLAEVLRVAGLKPTARHVAFHGLDVVPEGNAAFIRSIPIEKALDPNTLLAMRMNGLPLTPEHGFPVRGIVPGWIGSASIKWLQEIRVLPKEFDGFYMSPGYRRTVTDETAGADDGRSDRTIAITSLQVKSVITQPSDGAVLASQTPLTIRGASWAGESAIAKVEISVNEGRVWHLANLGSDYAKYAWRLWDYEWRPMRPGPYTILSRATDAAGRSQPMEPRWNPAGYLWNGVDRVHVELRD